MAIEFYICKGLSLIKNDIKNAIANSVSCLLVNTSNINEKSQLRKYLETYPEDKRDRNRTFKKRTIWHQPDDNMTPGAFFPYMQKDAPRIVLNTEGVTCTNTIHRIFFNSKTEQHIKKIIAILRNPVKSATHSGRFRPPVPEEVGRLFRLIPATHSDPCRPLFRSKATLFLFSQITGIKSTLFSSYAWNLLSSLFCKHCGPYDRVWHRPLSDHQ